MDKVNEGEGICSRKNQFIFTAPWKYFSERTSFNKVISIGVTAELGTKSPLIFLVKII
jgi:hypothetical protein